MDFYIKREESLYELQLKLNYGKHSISYNNENIELIYDKSHTTPLANAD